MPEIQAIIKTIISILLAFVVIVMAASCKKDNKAAKKLDGVWTLSSWSWVGKDSIPGATITLLLGTFTFNECKAATVNCDGSQVGFLGGTDTETFDWYFRSKGTKWTLGPGSLSGAQSVDLLTGEWDVDSQSDTRFVVSSSTCGSCMANGSSTLTFTK